MVNAIFLIGAPCVGKTTVGLQLQEQFGFKLIQMSEILNANGGDPIPSHISYNILKEKLSGLGSKEIAIIDGYPDTMESVLQWGVCEYAPICVILFESHSENLKLRRDEKLKCTTRGGIENIEKREALFAKYITDIVNLYIDMEILYSVDANQDKHHVLNKVCMILAREFHNRNIFKDQIILTRMKTVIDKGVEKSKPSKDQERINDVIPSVSKALSVSH